LTGRRIGDPLNSGWQNDHLLSREQANFDFSFIHMTKSSQRIQWVLIQLNREKAEDKIPYKVE
jgi:hypothetical protein